MDYSGKKLLVLAGASVHNKVVRAAKEMGIYTIVTDYLENSPAKQIADESWMFNITDVDGIVEKCKKENIDGVIGCYIDPCQRPYQKICEKLNMPCYGTFEQFFKMTDKRAFKEMCLNNDVNIIPEYSIDDVENGNVEYPVFVKPVDSRGSRGQSVCYNKAELLAAIDFAKKESSNEEIIIEKFITNAQEFQVTYFYVNGKPYLIRTVDSYSGPEELHLEKVVSCAVSPSKYTDFYLKTANDKVLKMFENLGMKNGPIFMQGFVDDNVFRFFDPGLRFPGVDYELIYNQAFNVDIIKKMIHFALYGDCIVDEQLPENGVWINNKRAAVLFPNVKAGTIKSIEGFDNIRAQDNVISLLPRCSVGDEIKWEYNVNQRSAEIDILCESTEILKKEIDKIQSKIVIKNIYGENLAYNLFDVNRID